MSIFQTKKIESTMISFGLKNLNQQIVGLEQTGSSGSQILKL